MPLHEKQPAIQTPNNRQFLHHASCCFQPRRHCLLIKTTNLHLTFERYYSLVDRQTWPSQFILDIPRYPTFDPSQNHSAAYLATHVKPISCGIRQFSSDGWSCLHVNLLYKKRTISSISQRVRLGLSLLFMSVYVENDFLPQRIMSFDNLYVNNAARVAVELLHKIFSVTFREFGKYLLFIQFNPPRLRRSCKFKFW